MRALWLIFGLGGCWPHIDGEWSDYDVPAEAGVVGEFWRREPLGDYWSDGGSRTAGFWFALIDPPVEVPAFPGYELVEGGCIDATTLTAPPTPPAFVPPDVSEVTVRSGSDVQTLFREGDTFGFRVDPEQVKPGEMWSLDPIGGDDRFSTDRLAVGPGAGTRVTEPSLDGAELAVVGREGFDVAWERDGDAAIVLFVELLDANFDLQRRLACDPGDADRLTVALDDLPSDVVVAYVNTWAHRSERGTVAWNEGGNRIETITILEGAVQFE